MHTRIGFSTTNHLLSRIIRKITGSKVSHVWWVFFDEALGCDMVMEAHFTYRLVPLSQFERTNKIIAIVTPRYSIDAAMRATTKWLGTAYDVTGLIGAGIVAVARRLRHCVKNPFRSARNVYCSESVMRGLLVAGYPSLSGDPETVEPDDLLEFFNSETR